MKIKKYLYLLEEVGPILILLCLPFTFLLGIKTEGLKTEFYKEVVEKYGDTYKFKSGYAEKFGDYKILTLDGGINWYVYEREGDGGIKILGTAEEKFPGLLKHLNAMDELVKYAQEHGPITLSGKSKESEISLLENAGFKVVAEKGE